jgi:trimeric autotransporter adhesin
LTQSGRRSLSQLSLVVLLLPVLGCEDLPAAPDTNLAPIATFFFTPVSPVYAGQSSVQFNAAGSRDEDGEIVDYTWDFGDGTSRVSGGPSVRHTFPDTSARCLEVTYGVSLTVTDDKGMSALVAEPVTVTELPAPTAPECK